MSASPSARYSPPPDAGLDVLYQDAHLLMIDKPAGLLSVPGRGPEKNDSLIVRAQRRFPEALVVHRLDMETSGILLLARGKAAQSRLSRLFQTHRVDKRYLAVVDGRPAACGEIDLPLITDWPNRPRQKVDFDIGKASQTRYRVLEPEGDSAIDGASRVALFPKTGRSHQLRVHMMSLGHAILGDRLYAAQTVRDRAPRLLLHAEFLGFPHPFTGHPVAVECPAPF